MSSQDEFKCTLSISSNSIVKKDVFTYKLKDTPFTSRPINALFWSHPATWMAINPSGRGHYPKDNDSVIIPHGTYVVVDTKLPLFNHLEVQGVLELDNVLDHKLQCNVLFINGGQFIAGWENRPILTKVEIILNGTKEDNFKFRLTNGLTHIESKSIGVFGGMDLHGKPRNVSWTTLSKTAWAGQDQISLNAPVDWEIGEQIVLTSTSYIATQTEVFTIRQISVDRKTIDLSANLTYAHLSFIEHFSMGSSVKIAAGVGLLTRNVKVIGAQYAGHESDLYGFTIHVSNYSTHNDNRTMRGYARLSDVEFYHAGRYYSPDLINDSSSYGVLISNLATYDLNRPTYVRSCAFHHGFSAAIGILDSASIPIENNVIYRTIYTALKIEGHSNIIRHNLVAMNYWSSSLTTSEEQDLFGDVYWGAIDARMAHSIVLEDNFVAGAERVGILFKGDVCNGSVLKSGMNHSIKSNIVHGSLGGVVILPEYQFEQLNCVSISDFTVYKSSHYGIYYQGGASLLADSNVLVENQVNIFAMVIGPDISSHLIANKRIHVQNSCIVGRTSTFDCANDANPNDLNFMSAESISSFGAGIDNRGMVGIGWGSFVSSDNNAPWKPW